MLCISIGVRLVTVGLSCLCKQNKRSGVGGLQTECEIEKDKRVDVKFRNSKGVQQNPDTYDYGLPDEKNWCSKKAGESLCF